MKISSQARHSSKGKPKSTKASIKDKSQTKQDNVSKKTHVNKDATRPPKPKRDRIEEMKARLMGSRFRYINELLYTNKSDKAFSEFQQDPNLFVEYHKGFNEQVSKWPVNPLDMIIGKIDALVSKSEQKPFTIVDMGCGEAKLAEILSQKKNITVKSYDLVACNERVTACNIAHTPSPNDSADIVVFSLSLMGTDFAQFLQEAYRILKIGGLMFVAEVKSRIEDVPQFKDLLTSIGFKATRMDDSNKMFIMIDCQKTGQVSSKASQKQKPLVDLKACLYKRR